MFLDLGKLCNQFLCVSCFITSKLPCSSTSETICLVCLCLNENFRSAPKLNEAIVLFFPIDFSSSLCHPIPSFPLCLFRRLLALYSLNMVVICSISSIDS